MKDSKRLVILNGFYARIDGFGRLYFDRCASDEEHLHAQAFEGSERPDCRTYVSDLFDTLEGRKGDWSIQIICNAQGEPHE